MYFFQPFKLLPIVLIVLLIVLRDVTLEYGWLLGGLRIAAVTLIPTVIFGFLNLRFKIKIFHRNKFLG